MTEKLKYTLIIILTIFFLGGFAIWGILKPSEAESVSERRPLASFPPLNAASVFSGKFMTDFEAYTLDQFPLRDQFRTVKAITTFYVLGQKDNNDIYIENGYASKLEYPMNTGSIEYAAKRFQFVYDKYLADKDVPIYLAVIPDKNYFMAQKNGYLSMDYETFVNELQNHMEFAAYIDIFPFLELSDYYRTDTHWRQEQILDVARYLASEMGVSLSADYTKKIIDTPFYGVYYGQSALPLATDELYYLDNTVLHECRVYDYETKSYIPVYDLKKAEGNDPYELFLSGPKPLLTIENPSAASDRELIIFRDSFGSSLAPLLVDGYQKITLVDIRYISPNVLDKFLSFEHQDILFLYSASVLNNSVTIK